MSTDEQQSYIRTIVINIPRLLLLSSVSTMARMMVMTRLSMTLLVISIVIRTRGVHVTSGRVTGLYTITSGTR